MSWTALFAAAGLVAAMAGEATAPKLESLPVPTAAGDVAPAEALPTVVSICVDRAARRCWTRAGAAGCEGSEIYATAGAGAVDLGALLRRCVDAVSQTKEP